MGFNNPRISWRELERRLSDRPSSPGSQRPRDGRRSDVPDGANGGDSPAWSPKRPAYEPPAQIVRRTNATPYAELHCHSSFSFLDGASQPEELVEQGARAGHEALAITDHDGLYGVVRFAEAARAVGLPTVFGAELSLDLSRPQNGEADPEGTHLLVLARGPEGYRRLASTISEAHLGSRGQRSKAEKGRPDYSGIDWSSAHHGEWLVLTGCRKGAVPRALLREGPAAAARELAYLVEIFGQANVAVELWDHGDPLDTARNNALAKLAVDQQVMLLATNNVHYAVPQRHRLASALAAVRARRSLDDLAGWLPAAPCAHLRSGDEQAKRFTRWPGVVEQAAELGRECAFDLKLVAPKLPPFPCPGDLDEMAYLRQLVDERAPERYGTRDAERAPGAWKQLDHELAVIDQLGYPGYFLVVWDIVDYCRQNDIFCQGRGSAANSAVCFVLGITNVDAVSLDLLFERFLSTARDGPPDIDIDIESGRREQVIQYVYERYGRDRAAQVANVITYRPRSAVRDMAKALGYDREAQDAMARRIGPWARLSSLTPGAAEPGSDAGDEVPELVVELAREVEHLPRHLGIHSGGMVICDRPVGDVCPVEWARMADRTVLQWDKDDCAAVRLVKFDLLGLGMLSALHNCFDLLREHRPSVSGGQAVMPNSHLRIDGALDEHMVADLAPIPREDPEVYEMLCQADSVGVFQVESRAQMATLPRLAPRKFYDLVVEVALIRPGPIQGGSVHPYIRRHKEQEEITYLHPSLENALKKTLGIPLFQEQLMQIVMDAAGFSAAEADQLRQAMGSKRSHERMEGLHQRFLDGTAEGGIDREMAERIWEKLVAFASYGFPESHSVSFAYLVYASSWLKRYFPAGFCAGLLNAQPMGFYSPHSLVQDARRHGVEVRTPDLNLSGAKATLEGEWEPLAVSRPPGETGVVVIPASAQAGAEPGEWGRAGQAVRLGLSSVRSLKEEVAERIVAVRERDGAFSSPEDLVRRVPGLTVYQTEVLATAGAFGCFGLDRREALWRAGAAAGMTVGAFQERLPGIICGTEAPPLPAMSLAEEARADLWATGVSPEGHPTRFVRARLDELGVVPASELVSLSSGQQVTVAGVVTHRQRPATASGTTFVNLEDETGLVNVVVSKGCWEHHRQVLLEVPALVVQGRLERQDNAISVAAQRISPLPIGAAAPSRDFR